jgi:hypothetical protein
MPAKRMLTAAMALLLAVSFATPSGALALTDNGFTYTQTGGAVTITGCATTCPTTLDIPAVLGGYFVTTIGTEAFKSKVLTALTIPSTVTTIGNSAFASNLLTTVTIPNSVTSIGTSAFSSNGLTSVTIPNSITSISRGAFYDNDLTSVSILGPVTSIGYAAFGFNALTSVAIPNTVTIIDDFAFGTNALTAVTIPNSVTTIGVGAFSVNLLASLTIPDSVTSIARGAFEWNSLTTVTIGNAVSFIGSHAFDYNQLTSFTFLGNAPLYRTDVFENNPNLTSVRRSYTATGWGDMYGGKPVVIADARADATIKPTVSGTAKVSKTLTAAGTWTGYPTPTLTYQWYACTKVVAAPSAAVPRTCKRITGATRSTFKLTSAQRGKYVAVLVTGTSLRTTATTWLSKTTAKVK